MKVSLLTRIDFCSRLPILHRYKHPATSHMRKQACCYQCQCADQATAILQKQGDTSHKSALTALVRYFCHAKTTHSISACGLTLNMKRSPQKMPFAWIAPACYGCHGTPALRFCTSGVIF